MLCPGSIVASSLLHHGCLLHDFLSFPLYCSGRVNQKIVILKFEVTVGRVLLSFASVIQYFTANLIRQKSISTHVVYKMNFSETEICDLSKGMFTKIVFFFCFFYPQPDKSYAKNLIIIRVILIWVIFIHSKYFDTEFAWD